VAILINKMLQFWLDVELTVVGDYVNDTELPTRWLESSQQYDHGYIHSPFRIVRVTLSGVRPGSKCTWKQDDTLIIG